MANSEISTATVASQPELIQQVANLIFCGDLPSHDDVPMTARDAAFGTTLCPGRRSSILNSEQYPRPRWRRGPSVSCFGSWLLRQNRQFTRRRNCFFGAGRPQGRPVVFCSDG
jgi:hypothetical protein